MNELKLGVILDEHQQRDAIHIAVAPVIASEELAPGEHVGFVTDDHETVGASGGNLLGIIDPFLKTSVQAGERCWLFLYPQTITSLRHNWTHPAFGTPASPSRQWIEAFAAELDQTYNRLMDAASLWVDDEEYTYDNSEQYKNVDSSKWPIFWTHYEIVTGRKVKSHDDHFFTCSC